MYYGPLDYLATRVYGEPQVPTFQQFQQNQLANGGLNAAYPPSLPPQPGQPVNGGLNAAYPPAMPPVGIPGPAWLPQRPIDQSHLTATYPFSR